MRRQYAVQCAAVAALALLPFSIAAQGRLGPEEKRPKLAADADTNDAAAYYTFATRNLEEKPAQSAAGFYWAARLDPSSADALDGRRAALIMRKYALYKLYMDGGKRARASKELRSIDSLQMRALRLDPLYYRKNDRTLLWTYLRKELMRDYPQASTGEVDMAIREYLTSGSAYMRAWLAYSEGRMEEAIREYESSMKKVKHPGYIRLDLARAMATAGRYPAAIKEFGIAIDEISKMEEDKDEDVIFYNSKAMAEHSRAIIYWQLRQPDSAKAVLGRAITEDLSYYAAHVELGKLALAERDTATALSELALAAELAADEPIVHYLQGSTMLAAGQHAEAVAPLKKALELEPFHAASHFTLAQALDRSGDAAGARASYTTYLSLAPLRDQERRTVAKERLAALVP